MVDPVAVLSNLKQLYDVIGNLGLNAELQDKLCKKVNELEGILLPIETTARDARDQVTEETLDKTKQILEKCLSACKRMKERNFLVSLLSTNSEVIELDNLLTESIQLLQTQLTASVYRDTNAGLKRIEKYIRNPHAFGAYPTELNSEDSEVQVTEVSAKEDSSGVIRVTWKGSANARHYELDYGDQSKAYIEVKPQESSLGIDHECLLDRTLIDFPDKFSYSIRIRGVNGKGPGMWSQCAVGKFIAVPSPLQKPLAIHINSSNSITLLVKQAHDEAGVEDAVTHYVVEYIRVGETEHVTKEFSVEELKDLAIKERNAYEIDLEWNIDTTPMPIYRVKISLKNKNGNSKVYEQEFPTGTIAPSEPVKPSFDDPVVYTNTNTIIIKWDKPGMNAYVVDHYKILWGKKRKIKKFRKTKNCHAVFRELESGMLYLFKVQAVSRMGLKSNFLEINAVTVSSAGAKARTTGAGAVGAARYALAAPFTAITTGVNAGTKAGKAAAESVEDKGKAAEVVAGTAAGIGGGILGFTVGLIVTPFAIVAMPFVGTATGVAASRERRDEEFDSYLKQYPDDSIDEYWEEQV